MDKRQLVADILKTVGVYATVPITKIDIGFSNDVFAIGNDYILKIGKSAADQPALEKEVYFCELFGKRVHAPIIVNSDTSMSVYDLPYILYKKIRGRNLYAEWHTYSDTKRRFVVEQICRILREINHTPYKEYAARFGVDPQLNWRGKICGRIELAISNIESHGSLDGTVLDSAREYVAAHSDALLQQNLGLTYFDPHFDNFLVSNNGDGKIVGTLDFERTDLASIDYVLDLVARMVKYPKKYVSEKGEHLIEDAHYASLLIWYQEFYPELFEFERLEERLRLYLIEHSLSDIYYFPEHPSARSELNELLLHC